MTTEGQTITYGRHAISNKTSVTSINIHFVCTALSQNQIIGFGPSRFIPANSSIAGMRRIVTFRSTTDRIYDGGPIRLLYYIINLILSQLPTVFSTVTSCTGL